MWPSATSVPFRRAVAPTVRKVCWMNPPIAGTVGPTSGHAVFPQVTALEGPAGASAELDGAINLS